MLYKYLILAFVISASQGLQAATKIYKVVKADGTVVYTDKPPPGSAEFKLLTKPNMMPAMPTPQRSTKADGTASSSQRINYQLAVTEPQNEATVRNNAGEVTIKGNIAPEAEGQFVLYLNGNKQASSSAPVFEVSDLNRGMYQIKIEYLDQSGKLLASSPQSVFYLHKASSLIQAN